MKITFDVKNQILTRTDRSQVIANSADYLEAEVTFSADWTGMEKTMQFKNGDYVISAILSSDKVEKEKHLNLGVGTWKVSIIGVAGDQKIVTNECNLSVNASGWIGSKAIPPESVWNQLLVTIQSLHTEAASDAVIRSAVQKYIEDNYDMLVKEAVILDDGTIQEVLNEMATDGVLSDLLAPLVRDEAATAAASEVSSWLADHVDPDTGYVIDDTLTVDTAAADAKATGEAIDAARNDFSYLGGFTPIDLDYDKVLKVYTSGCASITPEANSLFKNAVVSCNEGDKFLINGSNNFTGSPTYIFTIYAFLGAFDGNNYPVLSARQTTNTELKDTVVTAPENAKYLVINTNVDNPSYCYKFKTQENVTRQPIMFQGIFGATDDIDTYLWRGYWLVPQSTISTLISGGSLPPIKPGVCFLFVLSIDTPSSYGYGSMQILLSANNDTIIRYRTSLGWGDWTYKPPYVDYGFTDSVGGMVNVAESHFNEAYASGSNLVYQSRHGSGLFYPVAYYVYDGTAGGDDPALDGVPCTNCSQFISTLMKGVTYDNSRYVSGNNSGNKYSEWSWFSDGSGYYPSAGSMPVPSDSDSMPAADMYRYAEAHGWSQLVVKNEGVVDTCNVQVGDFIFTGDSVDDNPDEIGHIALVIHVGRNSKTVQVIEGWSTTKIDGSGKAGVRLHNYDWEDIIAYAKFPVADSDYMATKVYESNTVINKPADPDGSNVVTNVTNAYDWSEGFYTIKMKGVFDTLPYVSHTNDNSHYTNQNFVKNGDDYIATFHLDNNTIRININANKLYDRKITQIVIYKGYVK